MRIGTFLSICANAGLRLPLSVIGMVIVTFATTNSASAQIPADFVTIDPFDTAYADTSGVNDVSFRQNSITSVVVGGNAYQFAAYYRNTTPGNNRRITVARRRLGVSDWEIFDFTGSAFGDPNSNGTDGHNVISFGIDGEGYMHMSWGMHNNSLIYRKSLTPVTNANPISFGTTNQPMTGVSEDSVTYPQFYNLPDGDLLFFYRNGSSGNGNTYLNRYDTATDTWSAVQHPLFDGISSSVNSYPNTLAFDSQNEIHFTWTDRSTPAFQTNHNIYYARSPNEGVSWTKIDGTPYALPLLESTSQVAVPIPANSTLINQTSMTVDQNDNPMVATWWAPGAAQGDNTRQYMLAYYNGTAWQTSQISHRPPEPLQGDSTVRDLARPLVMVDDQNRVIVVMRYDQRGDVVTIGYSEDRQNWTLADLAAENLGDWEPTYDAALWQRDNKLHLFYQPITGAVSSTVSVLEWDEKAFFQAVGTQLTLQINRFTGATTITNTGTNTSAMTAYTISSAGSQLSPSGWNSLHDQSLPGWAETQALSTALAETNGGGSLSLPASGGSASLGNAFAGHAIAFGADTPADVTFQYTVNGQVRTGTVSYTGQSPNNLTLFVDPVTGVARLENTSPFSVAIDAYTVTSATNSLDPAGWYGLDDQNASGGQWFEANPTSGRISELQKSGNTLLTPGAYFELGKLFNENTGQQNLVLQFLIAGQSGTRPGVVRYAFLGIPGDYNDDGKVDAADYVVWRKNLDTSTLLPHDLTPGTVGQADFDVWRLHFGQTLFSAGSVSAASAVPEPSPLIVVGILAALQIARRRQRENAT